MVFCPVLIDIRNSIRPICGMVYREIIVVNCKNDSKYVNKLRGKNAEVLAMKMGVGIISTRH
jgi:hypothetical protein